MMMWDNKAKNSNCEAKYRGDAQITLHIPWTKKGVSRHVSRGVTYTCLGSWERTDTRKTRDTAPSSPRARMYMQNTG